MDTELQDVLRDTKTVLDELNTSGAEAKSMVFAALLARQDSIRLAEAIQQLSAMIRGKRFA
jgi:hypothetical protein